MNDEGAPFTTKKYAPADDEAPPFPTSEDDYGFDAPPPRGASQSRFVLIRFADFTPLEGDDYCVKGFLPRTGLAVFWGPPKSGKSFFVFDLLMHVALGWDYRGHRVRQGPVVYVCLEGGRAFRKRREAFRQAKLKGDEDPPFFFVVNPLSLAADRKALIEDIQRQLGHDVPAVVCIDTLNRSLEGSESSDKDMASYIKAADAIRDAFDCLIVIVHHCGHDGERPRGHSSLMGALEVQAAVSRDAEENVVTELELAKDGETGLVFVSRLEKIGSAAMRTAIRSPPASSGRPRTPQPRPPPGSPPRPGGRTKSKRSSEPSWTLMAGPPSMPRGLPASTASGSRWSKSTRCAMRSSRADSST
jgi:hypothetical protein